MRETDRQTMTEGLLTTLKVASSVLGDDAHFPQLNPMVSAFKFLKRMKRIFVVENTKLVHGYRYFIFVFFFKGCREIKKFFFGGGVT